MFIFFVQVPAWVYLGGSFLYPLAGARDLTSAAANRGGVAFFAHVGGFAFGALLTLALFNSGRVVPQSTSRRRRPGAPSDDRHRTPPNAPAPSDRNSTIRAAKATAAALAVVALAFGLCAGAERPRPSCCSRSRSQPRSARRVEAPDGTASPSRSDPPPLRRPRRSDRTARLARVHPRSTRSSMRSTRTRSPARTPPGRGFETGPSSLQHHLRQLPTGTELVHRVATYGHKAGEVDRDLLHARRDVVLRLEHDAILGSSPRSRRRRSARRRREPTSRSTDASAPTHAAAADDLRGRGVLSAGLYHRPQLLAARRRVRRPDRDRPDHRPADRLDPRPRRRPTTVTARRRLALLWLVVVREFQNYVVNPHIGRTVGLSPLVTLLSVAVVGVLFGGLAVVLAVPFTSAVATLVDVLVLGHDPPTAAPRRTPRPAR